jgi:hypothetical protein
MTVDPTPDDPADPPEVTAFARLAAELNELGYDAFGSVTYTATDGNAVVVLERRDSQTSQPNAVISGGEPAWEITFTATTPAETQLVILYAALNTAKPADGLAAAAAALAIPEP